MKPIWSVWMMDSIHLFNLYAVYAVVNILKSRLSIEIGRYDEEKCVSVQHYTVLCTDICLTGVIIVTAYLLVVNKEGKHMSYYLSCISLCIFKTPNRINIK